MSATAGTHAAWLKVLFSTEPADRPRAESGICNLYSACGLAHPRYILWFDSPFDTAWAVAMLCAAHDDVWHEIIQRESRCAAQRQRMERIQADVCRRITEPDWQRASSEVGVPFESFTPETAPEHIFELRSTLYASIEDLHKACAFNVDNDDLYRAEFHLLGIPSGVLGCQEGAGPSGVLINGSDRSRYPYSVIAADEAQGGTPAPLLAAHWEIARACGLWWAFEHAAILTDRPAEIHVNDRFLLHRADGPAVVYRDGAKAWAWNGRAMPEEWILHPDRIPRGYLRDADPSFRVHAERCGTVRSVRKRKATPGNFLARYLAGEHEQVWADLVALGPDVRRPRYKYEAVAVARETMRRVEANLRTIVARLQMLAYRFKTKGMWLDELAARADSVLDLPGAAGSPFAESLRESAQRQREERSLTDYQIRAHVPPGPHVATHLAELEKLAGPVPLSLWAFYEIVGAVDLIGYHDAISAEADTLVVLSLEELLQECADDITVDGRIPIAPDRYQKADISGGAPYEVAVPDARADAELLNEPHDLFFVDYLRLVFRHGGFPGYAGMDRGIPKEIAILAEGLQPF